MRITKDIRRLAFQTLYQLDARGGEHRDEIRAAQAGGWRPEGGAEAPADAKALDAAWALAEGAWEHRHAADAELAALAPDWPTSRLAAVDRAILRLACYEMTAEPPVAPPKVAVNDAINLAREFSTDRAPAFINGLLDKVLKRILGPQASAAQDQGIDQIASPPEVSPEPAARVLGGHEIPD